MQLDFLIYFTILIIVALNGLGRFNALTTPFKVLVLLILTVLLSEVTSRILVVKIKNSNPPYHIFTIIQYAAIAYIYSRLISGWRLHKLVLLSIIPYTILSLLNTFFFQNLFSFPSYSIVLSYILYIFFALVLFIQMLDSPKELTIFKQSVFWFNCAILIYSVTVTVCFGVLAYLIKNKFDDVLLSNFLEYLTFIYYIALGYAIHIDKNKLTGAYS